MAEKNNIEIKVGRYTILSDGLSLWIMEEYEGKDKDGKPKKQTRRVAGYAHSLDNLVHQFVAHKHKAAEAKTVADLIKVWKEVADDTEAIRKTALKHNLTHARKLGKEIKELNSK